MPGREDLPHWLSFADCTGERGWVSRKTGFIHLTCRPGWPVCEVGLVWSSRGSTIAGRLVTAKLGLLTSGERNSSCSPFRSKISIRARDCAGGGRLLGLPIRRVTPLDQAGASKSSAPPPARARPARLKNRL